ncbi:MAG: sigma-70 family RNA polymerase sigma factor [Flavobacteriales bacterium]|nr:sigma-70 family RNA polymerase sigma factor [Flavobacteriales bacterium]
MAELMPETERRKVFEGWVKAYTADLLRFARNRVQDTAVADDLVQITLISAWDTMDRFAGDSSPRTWLFAILKHKLMDHYRKAYREAARLSGNEADADDPAETLFTPNGHWLTDHAPQHNTDLYAEEDTNEKLDRALQHCLEALPERWRAALEMKYLREMDGTSIQATLGLSESNYWQQVHRAKLRLRACIEGRLMNTRNRGT